MSTPGTIIVESLIHESLITSSNIVDTLVCKTIPITDLPPVPVVEYSYVDEINPRQIVVKWDREMVPAVGLDKSVSEFVDKVVLPAGAVVSFNVQRPKLMYITMPTDFVAGAVITWAFKTPVLKDLLSQVANTDLHLVDNRLRLPVIHFGIPILHNAQLVYHTP